MRRSNCLYVIFLLGLLSACTGNKTEQNKTQALALLPVPVSMQNLQEHFKLQPGTKIVLSRENAGVQELADYLVEQLQMQYKLKVNVINDQDTSLTNSIYLSVDTTIQIPASAKKNAYVLEVRSERIQLRGQSPEALFYGLQTLLQLMNEDTGSSSVTVSGARILDYPAYDWRGMHLDVCRHFFPVEQLKKMIDAMAMHKLNVFHWHLTDDQGWRIEIKKYPLLTAVGGWRKETVVGHMSSHPLKFDGKKYGGFYTQEQIKEVVAYAKSRYITIVPEIEMPGHALAALSAYPEYSCTGGPFEVFTEWGETKEAFCGGKEKTFDFMQSILDEVITLFPGEYIHVGGDECDKQRWQNCTDCKKRMKEEHLKDVAALQSYFIKRVETYLNGKGKKLIGWDEILDGGLPSRSTVMSWRGTEGGIEASKAGHDVIMTPGKFCYFDHYQGNPETEPLAIGGFLPLDSVYAYSPQIGIDTTKTKHILGAQANVWTEYITSNEQLEYMVFPRLCAMAEILWSPKEKHNYVDFIQRMDNHYERLDKKNIHYRVDVPAGFNKINRVLEDSATVAMHCDIPSAEIRYTLDGSTPEKTAELYKKPFKIPLTTAKKVIAKTFLQNGKSSHTWSGYFEKMEPISGKKMENLKKGLTYNYFNQAFSSAEEILGKPTKTGVTDSIAFPSWIGAKQEWFAFEYKGFLKIDKSAVYTFYVNADDGAVLYIDDILVVDNDGFHYTQEKSGDISLGEGYHSFRLAYFEGKYTPVLEVKIMCQGLKKQALPSILLWH